jgi:hypothetical protein
MAAATLQMRPICIDRNRHPKRIITLSRVKWNTVHKKAHTQPWWHTATVSVISSFIATVFTAPLNAIKLMSIENNLHNWPTLTAHLRNHPLTALYRGYWTGVLRFAPRHAIEHTLYDTLRHMLPLPLAGCISTSSSVALLQPMDNLHIRRVLQRPPMSHRNMFNGVAPALAQSAISGFIWYSSLSTLREHISNDFALCIVSSFLCNSILHPLDVIKTYCNTYDMCSRHATCQLLTRYGPAGLFRGFPMVMATSVPCHAIAYGTYIVLKRALASQKCMRSHSH